MDKIELLAHIASLLGRHALDNDGRVNDEEPESTRVLSVSFDCDHKSGELLVLTHGKDGPVEYCISTEHIKETA